MITIVDDILIAETGKGREATALLHKQLVKRYGKVKIEHEPTSFVGYSILRDRSRRALTINMAAPIEAAVMMEWLWAEASWAAEIDREMREEVQAAAGRCDDNEWEEEVGGWYAYEAGSVPALVLVPPLTIAARDAERDAVEPGVADP